MDIQSALALLGNHEENSKFFKGQVRHFNVDGGSSLKEYLDRINGDAIMWLRELPQSIKSKPRFHKYKAPIYALLEHKDIVATYGQEYCSTVLKNIKNAFKDSIDKIINERKQSPAVEEDTPDSIHEHESDDDDSVLDIDILEVAQAGLVKNKSDETVDYKQQYELLKVKYDGLWREYNTVKGILSKTLELLGKMASR